MPDGCNVVQSPGLHPVDHVAACQDNHRVAVFADFAVSLAVNVGGSDEDAELAVPEPGDEP